jgi:hypothetical protein
MRDLLAILLLVMAFASEAEAEQGGYRKAKECW